MTAASKRIEAIAIEEQLEHFGFQVIYGADKGHGFWLKGIGWRSMKDCRSLLEPTQSAWKQFRQQQREQFRRYQISKGIPGDC